MNRRSLLEASVAALVALLVWWGGVTSLDGALAMRLPYDRYETVALLYPDVFYPGVPGLYLTDALYSLDVDVVLGSLTYVVGLLGWMVALSAAIGAGAVWYAPRLDRSPTIIAVAAVVALFVVITATEAVATLVA